MDASTPPLGGESKVGDVERDERRRLVLVDDVDAQIELQGTSGKLEGALT